MNDEPLKFNIDVFDTAWLTLDRPQVHNSFDSELIAELNGKLNGLERNEAVRALVLAAEGKNFSAGADLNWMRQTADYSADENFKDAEALAELMHALNVFSRPTIALVQGAAMGGGVGLVAACDIAIAAENAFFALSEVRLGIIPSVISPYVIAAMGQRNARRYMLTGEKFSAAEALRMGLVSEVVPAADLKERAGEILDQICLNGPKAVSEAKRTILAVSGRPVDRKLIHDTALNIAKLRASPEGREGISAFLEKRKPAWTVGPSKANSSKS